ncbi:phage distal tail protein [Streptomyces sp. NPDC020799]|uniref:phage distal tail protein n=1 Tax=Streptomyces sp. NPDC020799 TaxID=3365091 RepID=UPI0037ADC7BF
MTGINLTDWQLDMGGVLLGYGTSIPIAEIEGLGRPDGRGELTDQPGADGVWPAPDWYSGRKIRIDCAIKTPGDPAAARALLARLQAAADDPAVRTVGGAVMPLRIKWPGAPVRVLFGRLRKLDPEWAKAASGWVPLDLEFVATDPRFYGDSEQQVQLRLGWLSAGGFTAPVTAPIRVSGGDTGGQRRPGWMTNEGNLPAWPVITVYGPCANPRITQVSSGQSLQLNVVLSDGQWARIDTRPGQRHVTRNNGGTVLLTPDSDLDAFGIPPGRSEVRWTAADPTGTSRLTVTWRDAYKAL